MSGGLPPPPRKVMEMLNNRRHPKVYCPSRPDLGYGKSIGDVGLDKSVWDLAARFGMPARAHARIVAARAGCPLKWAARYATGGGDPRGGGGGSDGDDGGAAAADTSAPTAVAVNGESLPAAPVPGKAMTAAAATEGRAEGEESGPQQKRARMHVGGVVDVDTAE